MSGRNAKLLRRVALATKRREGVTASRHERNVKRGWLATPRRLRASLRFVLGRIVAHHAAGGTPMDLVAHG